MLSVKPVWCVVEESKNVSRFIFRQADLCGRSSSTPLYRLKTEGNPQWPGRNRNMRLQAYGGRAATKQTKEKCLSDLNTWIDDCADVKKTPSETKPLCMTE